MPISFPSTPSNIRIPFFAVEFDGTRAASGPALLEYRALIVGQKTASGSASANSLHKVTRESQVVTLAGRGSMLHRQYKAWSVANKQTEVWIGVLEDNGAGVAASGKIVFAGTATAAGTVSFYVGGEVVQVGVAVGDTAADVAAALADELPSSSDFIVTAAVDGSVDEEVDITCRHKGTVGNGIDLRLNYQDGEELPDGITATITAMASGATNPVLTSLVAALGDSWFNIITMPYTDATSLTAMENELSSRWGPMRMIDGHCFTAADDTHANLTTLGDSRNSKHVTIVACDSSPTLPAEYAANVAAVVAIEGAKDPARPHQTLPLVWVKAPAEADQFTQEERNLLLYSGIASCKPSAGGVVRIERLITTYKTGDSGADDTTYLDSTTLLTLMYLRYSFRTQMLNRYPRHKLAADGTRFGAGQAIITPKVGKAEACAWFRQMENLGLVENFDQFKTDLVVERDVSNPNRLNFLMSPDLINSFIVGAANIQFIL